MLARLGELEKIESYLSRLSIVKTRPLAKSSIYGDAIPGGLASTPRSVN